MASKIYKGVINAVDKFVPRALRPLWEHEAGPKTIYFWAPTCKWSIVFAGFGDLNRPAETISVGQCSSLAAAGFIWSRYAMVVKPKNWNLFSVNLFVAIINLYQVARVIVYQSQGGEAKK